ncbi:MAG: hypothetical protein II399_04315 [Lachnospiraceae bacterium]|nr:hypothetical protein [Lachnospiraceae bacterium]
MENMQDKIAALRDAMVPRSRSREENRALCEKYPFLTWYGDPLYKGYDESKEVTYDYTWEDELPPGWRKAFCPQMWDELKVILEKADYVKEFRWAQIKEKYGGLRLYDCGVPYSIHKEYMEWSTKYESLSENVCIKCGKPATRQTTGWITFVCDECAKKIKGSAVPIVNANEMQCDMKKSFELK